MTHWRNRGVIAALAAAMLFGAGTPLAKVLLHQTNPWLLAALLYLGAGVGLFLVRVVRRQSTPRLTAKEAGWLLGAVVAGGVIAPVLLMWGLGKMPASGASLLLNAEGVFTALIAWIVFRENFDRRIALGMAFIVAGAVAVSWPGSAEFSDTLPALAVLGACLFWGLDNNLTRNVSLADPTFTAMVKGLVAGVVNLTLALWAGAMLPAWTTVLASGVLGFLSYGVSLALFVTALGHLGTARSGAYFSTAPFAGAVLSLVVVGEPLTPGLLAAGVLMGIGVWLHLTERHEHAHRHDSLEHAHSHEHDAHHLHTHGFAVPAGTRHTHWHRHDPLTHTHPHFPDEHHRHDH
jgi:drug/metabolite transporter (DMT)-like permease